jgi:hypothetical protein
MAEIKIRSLADQMLPSLADCVERLYQGRARATEMVQTKEWAMVGALGNDMVSGKIPDYEQATPRQEALPMASAFYQRAHEAGLKTQNYDKGFDKFVRKSNPKEEMTATIAAALGCQDDHGCAVYGTEESRRCLIQIHNI